MTGDNINGRALQGTRGQIVRLLRARPRTVGELSKALGLTDNAIRVQLASLGADGMVSQAGKRRAVRKPEFLYELTSQAEQLFPKAYAPLLDHLLTAFRHRLSPGEYRDAVEDAATSLSEQMPDGGRGVAEEAIRVVEALGGVAEAVPADDAGFIIRGASCPFRDLVVEHSEICHFAAVLLSKRTGQHVVAQCEREGVPRCVFAVPPA